MPVNLKSLEALIQKGFEQTTKGQFVEALVFFQEGIRSVVMMALTDAKELKQVQT